MSNYLEKLKYISKDEALLLMKEEYGQDFIKELVITPLDVETIAIPSPFNTLGKSLELEYFLKPIALGDASNVVMVVLNIVENAAIPII